MSWEDCGYRPNVRDAELCPKGACSECDGHHHFICDAGGERLVFICKHCDVRAALIDEDEDDLLDAIE